MSKSIILASKSWLRGQILDKSEFDYQVVESRVDERSLEAELNEKTPEEITIVIAEAKALAVEAGIGDIVIGADTVAYEKDSKKVYHKAGSLDEAEELCMRQSGAVVVVITGFAIARQGRIEHRGYSRTEVRYSRFSKEALRKLFTKDGRMLERNAALGFFIDAPGFTLVEHFEGSYTGAMGLPMEQIRPLLEQQLAS